MVAPLKGITCATKPSSLSVYLSEGADLGEPDAIAEGVAERSSGATLPTECETGASPLPNPSTQLWATSRAVRNEDIVSSFFRFFETLEFTLYRASLSHWLQRIESLKIRNYYFFYCEGSQHQVLKMNLAVLAHDQIYLR